MNQTMKHYLLTWYGITDFSAALGFDLLKSYHDTDDNPIPGILSYDLGARSNIDSTEFQQPI